jgi:hypothetical protein
MIVTFELHIVGQETSIAHYIIQQYLAATGCLKRECAKTMYATGMVKMICCETEVSSGKNVKTLGTRSVENGCFVLWQMLPGKWSLDLVVGNNQVIAGSDGKIVWRHTSWLGTHAAKGPQRPLRRLIQVLEIASYFIFMNFIPANMASFTLAWSIYIYIYMVLLWAFAYAWPNLSM